MTESNADWSVSSCAQESISSSTPRYAGSIRRALARRFTANPIPRRCKTPFSDRGRNRRSILDWLFPAITVASQKLPCQVSSPTVAYATFYSQE